MNIVILASARGESNTLRAVKELCPVQDYELIDLRDKHVGQYDYDHSKNEGDDFQDIAEKIGLADTVIFATPVYWYSMSGLMKVFIDRFTELLSTHKPIGKALKNKKVYLISTGSEENLPPGFETPFKLTAEYFDMHFLETFYLSVR